MYARRAHYPNMQFQLQEELPTQTCNLLLCSSSFILSTKPIIVKPYRLGHKSQIQISNLRSLMKTSTMKFPSLPLCSTQLRMSLSLLLTITSNQCS